MNLFDLVAVLRLDSSQYEKGLGDADEKAKGFGGKVGKFLAGGTAVVAGMTTAVTGLGIAFTNGAKDVANYGDNVDKMSQKLGLSAESYQKWDYVINLAGADIDSMSTGLKTLTNKLDSARNGSKGSIEAFQKLGLSMEDLEGASREEVFEKTIKAFQGMEDSAERASLANKLFGRSGQELTPLFNQSAESTEALLEQAEKYGMVMSDKAVKASADFNDSLTTLGNTTTGLKNRLMGEFLPAMTEITDGLALVFTGDFSGADKMVEGIDHLIDDISNKIPEVFELGGKIVSGLASAIVRGAPTLFKEGTRILADLVVQFTKKLPEMVSIGTDIIMSVIGGITDAIPNLVEVIPDVIVSLIVAISENLPKIIEGGGKILLAIVEGLIKAIPRLIQQVPKMIASFVRAIVNSKQAIIASGGQIVSALLQGISNLWGSFKQKVATFARGIPTTIKNAIKGLWSIGRDIVSGIWSGISGSLTWIKNLISGWVGNVKDFLKRLFGIASPSKWARDVIGKNIVKGLALGIEDGEELVQSSFDDIMPVYDPEDYTVSLDRSSGNGIGGVSIVNYITVDGAENPEDFTDRFVRRLRMDMRTV